MRRLLISLLVAGCLASVQALAASSQFSGPRGSGGGGGGGGTVTSVATSGGLTGGTITTTGTVSIAAGGVTYAKIQNVGASSLLGNPTGLAAAPAEITLGQGLAFSGTTLVVPNGGVTNAMLSAITALPSGVAATSMALTTPNIGAASGTSLSVSGQLTSTVATGTAPLAVSSTTNVANLNASSLNGATFAAPGAIGGGTAAAGTFTALTATSSLTATGLVTLADLATQAGNTVLVNATGSAASPTAQAVGGCSAAADALIWTTNTGFGCNTAITAAAVPASGLTGTTLAASVVTSSLTSVGTLTGGSTGAGFTVALATSTITGVLPVANAGSSAASHAALVDVAGAAIWKVVPDCTDTAGNHLNYTQSTDAFSCGTTASYSLTVTDGTNTVAGATTLTAGAGMLVGGTTPSATLNLTTTLNVQSGTGAYAIVAADAAKLIIRTNASGGADTIANATGALGNGYGTNYQTSGFAGNTITAATAKINNLSAITLGAYQGLSLSSSGGNYYAMLGLPQPPTQTGTTVLRDDMAWTPFGTAGAAATGTSGHTLPYLDGLNTWSGAQTFGQVLGTQTSQAGTTYTVAQTDCGTTVKFTSGSAIAVTVPSTITGVCHVALIQLGAGQITVSAGASATLNSGESFTKTAHQYSVIGVSNIGTTAADWILTGDGA